MKLGLDGLLAQRLPRTVSLLELDPGALKDAVRQARADANADVALGVSAHPDDRSAEMVLITAHGEKTHRITYGGPPRSLPQWAANLALNWLRTTAQELP